MPPDDGKPPDLDCFTPALPAALALYAEREAARIEHLSDEELLAEAAAAGVDVSAEGARVRRVLMAGIDAAREQFTIGAPQRVPPWKRIDVDLASRPYVCPPVRSVDCPTCGAAVGVRCVGIDDWGMCHIDRLLKCAEESPLNRPGVEETPAVIAARAARLQAVERDLGARLGLAPEALADELPRRLQACEIDEDDLVNEWLLLRSELEV